MLLAALHSLSAASPAACDPNAVRSQIETLNAEFAYRIDHDQSHRVAELFEGDGSYDLGNGNVLHGKTELEQAYSARAARGQRTARHLFMNLRIDDPCSTVVRGTTVLLLFAQDGAPPLPAVPLGVADYQDSYRRQPDGSWRYVTRRVIPLFADPDRQPVLGKSK